MPSASYSPPRPIASVDEAATILRAAGHRFTSSRRVALEGLLAAEGPVSAEYLAGGLGGSTGTSDLPSAYRNLELFERLGLVRHVHIGHSAGLYALVAERERSYAVCERCGKLARLESDELEGIREQIKRASGFEASFTHFPILGLCRRCARGAHEGNPTGGTMTHHGDPDEHEHAHAHDDAHSHDHAHGGETHSHPHDTHDHVHVEHEHDHSHGDRVHSHPHVHQEGLEEEHEHTHDD